MNLKDLQQTANSRTKSVLGAFTDRPTGQSKLLIDNYKKAYNDIETQLKELYLKQLSGVNPEDYYNEAIKFNRLSNLQKQIAKSYTDAAKKAGLAQVELSKTAISNQYYQNMYSVNWFSGTHGYEYFSVLNPNVANVSVFSTPEVWKAIKAADRPELMKYMSKSGTLISTLRDNSVKDQLKIAQSVTQGLIKGESFTKLAKNIKGIFNTTANNAIRIARTEGIRNMNAGALANTQAAIDSGVDIGREVVEIMDGRTRNQSASINGQKQKGADPFHYPGGLKVDIIGNSGVAAYDVNERGTSVDYLVGMDSNTIDGINPVTGKHGNADMRDFNKWMVDNDLKYTDSGRITSIGKTAF